MKERPIILNTEMVKAVLEGRKTQTRRIIKPQPKWIGNPNIPFKTIDADPKGIINCPYGQVGDRLYVRETWCKPDDEVFYRAQHDMQPEEHALWDGRWKPSIHMLKKYARIWLEITDIRVERVQDISEEDAQKEGIEFSKDFKARVGFIHLWEKLYKNWNVNPWVWVIEFKKQEDRK